jgi:hypothetical protein
LRYPPRSCFPAAPKKPAKVEKAEITGTVMRQDVNAAGSAIGDPYPFQETRVYIVYGDHTTSDDDVRTGPDGKYSFRWLRERRLHRVHLR